MNRLAIVLFALITTQCGKPSQGFVAPASPAAAEVSLKSWVGDYLAGDAEDVGVALELLDSGEFEAWDFSCVADGKMKGTWSVEGDWVQFFITEAIVERGEIEKFSPLPRMKRVNFMNEVILLPEGDLRLLELEAFRIIDVYTKGDRNSRERFLMAWFEKNPLGG